VRFLASDLRQKATDLNLAGRVVTLNRLHKFVREFWPLEYRIPSREMIRRIMCEMGWRYKDASKAKNFVESSEIKVPRRKYLLQRRSEEFKGALFVWMDESYCNQYHVHNKVRFLSHAFHFHWHRTFYSCTDTRASIDMVLSWNDCHP